MHNPINSISCEESMHLSELGPRPLVIRDVLTCDAISWTPDYLNRRLPDQNVRVSIAESGSFSHASSGKTFREEVMPFRAACELITDPEADASYYVMQRSLHDELAELSTDVETPAMVDPKHLLSTNLWFGSCGTVSQLHFDGSNNLLCQIFGRKVVTIFSPEDTKNLYPLPIWEKYAHVSEIALARPDFDRFPLLMHATPMEIVLAHGDALYLPAYWWHHVRSLDISISLNFWWRNNPNQFFTPNSLRDLVVRFDRNRLIDLEAVGGPLAVAKEAVQRKDMEWVAVLTASAAVEQRLRELLRCCAVDDGQIPSRIEALHGALLARAPHRCGITTEQVAIWREALGMARSHERRVFLASRVVRQMVSDIESFMRLTDNTVRQDLPLAVSVTSWT